MCLGQPDRVPVVEFVIDEKVARAAVPDCRDVADCMDRLDMDCVGCGAFFAHGGGFILSSSNSIHSSCRPENFKAMIEACREFGEYPIQ